ncbi:MAG: PQQ-binding-like beta-propeller repeat protein [Phycisphaerales bacterium]|nr:MAG: PQQ-binding-like beta-propeller repeat protein [Phycisphaerales bacterium]
MNCAQVNRKIELFVLGDLSESEQTAIEDHLASCTACRVAHDEYRFLVAQIKESARPDLLTPDFNFAREVRSAVKVAIRRASYRTLAWRVIPALGSVAACLLVAFAGWWMWISSGGRLELILAEDDPRRLSVRALGELSVLEAWRHKSAPSAPGSMADAVVIHGHKMYLLQTYDGDKHVAALDTRSGEQKWLSDIESCGYLLADDSRVYCLSHSGPGKIDLLALDATDGRLLWRHQKKHADKLHNPCRPSLLPQDRICWTADGAVHMLRRADGEPVWTRSIPDGDTLSAAVAVGNDLYVASAFGLYCLDATTGDESWRLACGNVRSSRSRPMLAAAGGQIYASMSLGLRSSRLFCMNVAQREIAWSKVVDCAARLDAVGDVLYVRDQNIRALEGTTGLLLWTCPATGCNPVTYAEDLAYFVDSSDQGRLVALDRYTGVRVWEMAGIKSCDAFIRIDGTGFLRTPDGFVHAFIFEG